VRKEWGNVLRYFVAANGWLLLAILLLVGSGDAGSFGPDTYRSFFGSGKLPTIIYFAIVIAVAALAAWYFVLYRRTGSRIAEPDAPADRSR
jgi:hypothetical protein